MELSLARNPGPLPPLPDRLQANRDEIAHVCERRIRIAYPSMAAEDVETLVDHIPQFLDSVAAHLRTGPVSLKESNSEKRISRKHGAQRASLRTYTMETLLAEYRIMRQAIFEVLEREAEIRKDDRDAILDMLQLGAKNAAYQFMHDRTVNAQPFKWIPVSTRAKCLSSAGIVAVAAGVQWLLSPYLDNTPFICFYPAIVVACLLADGFAATVLSALVAQLVFVEPRWSLHLNIPGDVIRLSLFMFNASLITVVSNFTRKAKLRADMLARDQEKARRELEESESRFREMADSIPQMAWIADPDGEINWFNQRWYSFTNTKPSELKGFEWLKKVHHPDHIDESHRHYLQHIREGKAWEDEFPLRDKNGDYRWFLSRARPIRDTQGKIVRWFGTNTDVQDYKQLIAALEDERSVRERFANALTHDLKNPLSAVKMAAQIALRRKNIDEPTEKSLRRIQDNVERMEKMINDLLDASRLKAGKPLTIAVGHCDLTATLTHCLEELAMIHGNRFVLKDHAPVWGYWSCDGLQRIFENLLGNAVKYGSDTTPITVTLQEQKEAVRVEVHNFGGELTAEEASNLFRMFQRSRRAEESGTPGWGIGLMLVKGITEAHGGQVWVESGKGNGTTFTVELPRDARPYVSGHRGKPEYGQA